jgi:hypothetical protein
MNVGESVVMCKGETVVGIQNYSAETKTNVKTCVQHALFKDGVSTTGLYNAQ